MKRKVQIWHFRKEEMPKYTIFGNEKDGMQMLEFFCASNQKRQLYLGRKDVKTGSKVGKTARKRPIVQNKIPFY